MILIRWLISGGFRNVIDLFESDLSVSLSGVETDKRT